MRKYLSLFHIYSDDHTNAFSIHLIKALFTMLLWSERHVLEDTRYAVIRSCSIVRLLWLITHRISILRCHIVCE
jgi:hypothetical protein